MKDNLERIEKIIVDGQKEILEKIVENSNGIKANADGIRANADGIRANADGIKANAKRIKAMHASLKTEIRVTALALEDKLDEHTRQPVHA